MSKTMLKGIHRRAVGISTNNELMGTSGITAGGDGKPTVMFPGPETVAIFDDFLGDLLGDEWAFVKGDTGTVSTGVLTTATNGVLRLTHEPIPLNVSGENLALTQGLFKNWKANAAKGGRDGRLRLGARVKIESVSRTAARQHVFVGFSDSGGAEFPAYDTGAGVISNAADLVGFLFSPGGDTGWSLVSARAGTAQLAVAGASYGPSTNTYTTVELEVATNPSDTGGKATFWVDGRIVGKIDSPLTSSVAVTPWIGFWVQDTGPRFIDIDYVNISAPRDTGM